MRSKSLDLDDIGFIGIGRPMTEEETRTASAHIQAYKAKQLATKGKGKFARAKTAKKAATRQRFPAALKAHIRSLAGKKNVSLDDIGFIGTGEPYTDEDARAVSAYIQAEKAKRTAAERATKRPPTKRATKPAPAKRAAKATRAKKVPTKRTQKARAAR